MADNTVCECPEYIPVQDIATPLYMACGGVIYRLHVTGRAENITCENGENLEERLSVIAKAINANLDISTHIPAGCGLRADAAGDIYLDMAGMNTASRKAMFEACIAAGYGLIADTSGKLSFSASAVTDPAKGLEVSAGKIGVKAKAAGPVTVDANGVGLDLKDGGGLAVSGGKLAVAPADIADTAKGLETAGGKIGVKAKAASPVTVDATGVGLDLKDGGGLAVSGGKLAVAPADIADTSKGLETAGGKIGVKAKAAGPVTVDATGVGIDLKDGGGLAVSGGKLAVTASDLVDTAKGLETGAGKIGVKAQTAGGLVVGATGLGLDLLANGGLGLSGGKLYVKWADMAAANVQTIVQGMAGGGLGVDATGNLYVNFSSMPDSQMQQIVLQMVQEGGGLAVDNSGKIFVDFSTMPETKFREILSQIRVPFWLKGNTFFYVNGSSAAASDTIDDKRGESATKPFRTIQAAINYVTENYNFMGYNATILIYNGATYEEAISLPDYNSTTGKLYLRSWDGTDNKSAASTRAEIINKHVTSSPSLTSVITMNSSKTFVLENLKLNRCPNAAMDSSHRHAMALTLTGTGTVDTYGCHFCVDLHDGEVSSTDSSLLVTAEVLRANGGYINLNLFSLPTIIELVDNPALNVNGMNVLRIGQGGTIQTGYSSSATYSDEILVRVTRCSIFCFAGGGNFITGYGSGYTKPYMKFALAPNYTITGKRYTASNGGKIMTGGRGANYFPGSIAGTADADTYSWYN